MMTRRRAARTPPPPRPAGATEAQVTAQVRDAARLFGVVLTAAT